MVAPHVDLGAALQLAQAANVAPAVAVTLLTEVQDGMALGMAKRSGGK